MSKPKLSMLSSSISIEKMGFYIGVFNFFINLSQILASVFLDGNFLRFLEIKVHTVLLLEVPVGSAAILMLRIKEPKECNQNNMPVLQVYQ